MGLDIMKKHKPQKVLLGCFWAQYMVKNTVADPVEYYSEDFETYLKPAFEYIKSILSLGIKVSIMSLDVHGKNYSPRNMVDFYGLVEENMKPVKYS